MMRRAPTLRRRLAVSGLLLALAGPRARARPAGATGFSGRWRGLNRLVPAAGQGAFILVNVAGERLELFENGARVATWPVSTGRRGTGERRGSFATPLGLFAVARKLGAGLPEFSVLSRHGPTGGAARPVFAPGDFAAGALITTRILMLRGLEPGWNEGGDVDTLARHIYIHGTADLGQLGRPASQGCIEMAPGAMIHLFRAVTLGTPVLIVPRLRGLAAIPGEAAEQTPLG